MNPLGQARQAINALTPDELHQIRDEIAVLLLAYETGGALTGRGWMEVKTIPKQYSRVNADGISETETRYYHYAYVRRAQISENGRVTTATVGYYGRGGMDAINAGLGPLLLEAHIRGGESEGDVFLAERGFETPARRFPESKPPLTAPEHPLGDTSVKTADLDKSPLFQFLRQVAPVDADRLYGDVLNFEHDHWRYQDANERGLRYRIDNDELRSRRVRAARKDKPPRPGTLRRKRRE